MEHVVEGLGGSTIEMAEEQVKGSISKDLMPSVEVTFGSHPFSDVGRSLDPNGFGIMGLDLSTSTHKEAYLEKPNPQEMDGLGPFREEAFLGPKAGSSTALVDMDPFFLKNPQPTLHAQGFCLETENDRHVKTSPSSPPFVFG